MILTQDLDFSAILAATRREKPSVIPIRAADVSPEAASQVVIAAIRQMDVELEEGALIAVDPVRVRVRLLPLRAS